MEVTVSGLPRPRRLAIQAQVERLNGRYSGALTCGATAAVVVEGVVDWLAPKLAAAVANGIPVVSCEWLEDSALHGFLLCPAPYRLAPGQSGRRSSAASTSHAPTAAALPLPAEPIPPQERPEIPAASPEAGQTSPAAGALNLSPLLAAAAEPGRSAQHPRRSFSSPELEKLRGEAAGAGHSPLAAPFMEPLQCWLASPGAADSSAAAWVQEGEQRAVTGGRPLSPLASPASPPAGLLRCGDALPELASPALLAAHDMLLPLPEVDAWDEGQGTSLGASPATARRSSQGAASPAAVQAALQEAVSDPACTPEAAAAAAGGSGSPRDETDSEALVARFLSRMPQVTLARGSCLPRWLASGGSSEQAADIGTTPLLHSRGGVGSAERRDSRGPGSCSRTAVLERPALRAMQLAPDVVLELDCLGESAAAGAGCAESGAQRAQREGSRSEQAGPWLRPPAPAEDRPLPATTLIRMGGLLQHPPPSSTLEGVAERHGAPGGAAGGAWQQCSARGSAAHAPPPSVPFFQSAVALLEDGSTLEFAAGDTSHGALLLYDISEGGEREHALALVQSIYRLGDEAWMEHRYLFSKDDMLSRPRWAAATARAMRPGELLLSAGAYHSPMHLICGDFALSFPGHALRVNKAQGGQGWQAAQQLSVQEQQDCGGESGGGRRAYTCRKGFDAAAGAVVPLRRALEGFAG